MSRHSARKHTTDEPHPQSLSAFTYRPTAQQLRKYATTNLLTYPTLARSKTVVLPIPQPTGLHTSPVVSNRFLSIIHTLRARTVYILHTARQARGPTPLTGPRKRQHTFGTVARSHSAFTITDGMGTREHSPPPYPCSNQHNNVSSALDLSERHRQATQHKRTLHTLVVSFELSLHVVHRAPTKLAHRQQTPDIQPASHIPGSSQHPHRPYVAGQPHNDRHAGSYSLSIIQHT